MNALKLPSLSIIIPALNEAEGVERLLQSLSEMRSCGVEIIVVDGGSEDGTLDIARTLADQVVTTPRGRAAQMNAGAALARGQTFLFLHADSYLPRDADILVSSALARSKRVWGRFKIGFDSSHPALVLVSIMINFRTRLTGIATGDQAIFVRSEIFKSLGGYPDIPLMEDIALSKALRALTRPVSIPQKVVTSARRWQEHGILRTIFLMWRLRLSYFLGSDPRALQRLYEGKPRES